MTNKTFLLTGGTGFLGSFLSIKLLENGDRVVFLGRAKNNQSFKERLFRVLELTNHKINLQNIETVEIDFQRENLGISNEYLEHLEGKIDGIWHLAASLSFKEKDKKETFNTNVNGLKNALSLSEHLKCPFYYVSTAYVHGKRPEEKIFERETTKPRKFNNPYEESKFEAEKLVIEWSKLNHGEFIIFRPSILIEKTQRGLGFFGYYAVVYSLYKSQKFLCNKKIPIIFPYSESSSLNLIPVEIAAKWMMEISSKQEALGKIFHITNPCPFLIKELAEQTFGTFNIKIIAVKMPKWIVKLCFNAFCFFGSWIPGIKKIARKFKYYKYYITENNYYDISNVKKVLGDDIEKEFNFCEDFIKTIALDFSKKIGEELRK